MSSVFKFFGEIGLKADEVEKGLKKASSDSESTASKMTDTFKKAAIAIGSIFAAGKIIDFGKMAVEASANAQAMEAQFEQVFGAMQGQATQMIDGMSEEFGILPERLMPGYTQLTSMFKGVGMESEKAMETAKTATSAAADAAAFYDTSMESAQGSITSFVKGNYEAGESIGIFANDAQMAQHAIETGVVSSTKEWKALDEATKQATRVDYIENMQEMSGASGQAAREMDGLENVLGNLKSSWNTFLAVVGAPILQAVIPILQGITSAVLWLSEAVKPATASMGEFFEGIAQPFEQAYGLIMSLFDLLNGGTEFDQIVSLQKLGLTRADIDMFMNFVDGFKSFVDVIKKSVKREFKQLKSWFDDFADILGEIDFGLLLERLVEFGKIALETFEDIANGTLDFLEPVIKFWGNAFDTIKDLFKGLVTAFNQAMSGDWSGAFDTLKTAIGEALTSMGDNILTYWSEIWDNVKEFTSSIDWGSVATTIMTAIGTALQLRAEFLGDIGATIKSWISEKLGLGEDGSWGDIGSKILTNIKAGIESAKSSVSGLGTLITDWIKDKLGLSEDANWITIGTTILQNIIDAASSAGEVLGEFVTNLITGINDLMTAEQFNEFVRNFLSFIATAVAGAAVALLAIAVAFLDGFIAGVLGQDSKFGTIATDILGAIEKYINNSEEMNIDWYKVLGIPNVLRAWLNNETIPYMFNRDMYDGPTFQESHQGNPEDDRGSGGRSNEGTSSSRTSWFSPKTASAASDTGRAFQTQSPQLPATIDTSAVDALVAAVTAKINAAVTSIEQLGRTYTAKLIDGMTAGITTNQSKVILNIGILGIQMKTAFEKANTGVLQAIKQAMAKVQIEYRSGLLKAYATVRDNLARITEAFRSQISSVTSAGADTGRGFYNGLSGQRGRIVRLASDIASSVASTMRRALDINSPSGVTEEIGEWTIAGLVNSLTKGAKAVGDASTQVSDAMLFNPQEVDFDFRASNQATSAKPSRAEIMLDETTQLLRQLLDKDDVLALDGYVLGSKGSKYINQHNDLMASRRSRLQGGV